MGLPLSAHHLYRRRAGIAGLAAVTAVLQVAAGAGMAYVAGFTQVGDVLRQVRWYWLVALVASLAVSLVGYHFSCRGAYEAAGGPGLESAQMRSVSIGGFGGFLAHGGSGLDKYALTAAGADERDAAVRVGALAGLEHGVLGLIGTAAAIVVLAADLPAPPLDFSLPWAVIPVPGFIAAFLLADRYAGRFRTAPTGWRCHLGVFLDSVRLVRRLFATLLQAPPAVFGMAVFWGSEMFAVWAGMAAFGFRMNGAQLVLGVGTGMLFTRRTGPLAGAGVLILTLAPSVYYSGAPLPVAVVGVCAYRILSLWLPMPLSIAQLPRLRRMGRPGVPGAPDRAAAPDEPGLSDPETA